MMEPRMLDLSRVKPLNHLHYCGECDEAWECSNDPCALAWSHPCPACESRAVLLESVPDVDEGYP